jgi:OmpA-OmpF porin, OOP family
MLKRTIASFVAVAALSAPAFGAQFGAPGESGLYGGFGLGRSDAEVNATGITADDNDNAWKVFGGYQINRYFGVELGYHDLGGISAAGPGGAVGFDSTALSAALVGSIPITQRFAGFAKLGVARTETDATGVLGGVPVAGSDRNTDATYGLGLRYDFTKMFGVRGEWERFRAGGGSVGGKSDIDVFSVSGVVRFW